MSGIIGRLRKRFQAVPVDPLASRSEATLCTTCAALDLKKTLQDGIPEAEMVSLGTYLDITKKSHHCTFCRLIADLIQRRWHLDDFPSADIRETHFSLSASTSGTLIPGLVKEKRAHRLFIHATRPVDITIALMTARATLYMDIQLLEEDSGKVSRSKDLHGRRIDNMVDVHLIKKWMKLCENAHGKACDVVWWKSGHEDLPECVRMVDVMQMALVRAGQNCRYVALSYVWGGNGEDYWTSTDNAGVRNHPSGLKESALPATIVDAIQLTRQIGEQYLWVDALCIIQDSQEDKAAQISVMDRIYGRATLTIVAASGECVWTGLAGMRTGSRSPNQHIEHIQGLHFSIPLPPLAEAATESVWNTRGWTFQEAVLSRRRLYFTKHQTYFECEQDVWCEDLVAESKTLRGSSNPIRYFRLHSALLDQYNAADTHLRDYEVAIGEYSRRHLTVDSDILPALSALTNAMTRVLEPAGSNPNEVFRFGMWIRNLDLSLLWQPRFDAIHTRRIVLNADRPYWPSWAWSGWKGGVDYGVESQMLDGTDADLHPVPAESLIATWHLVDRDGAIVRLDIGRIPRSWTVDENAVDGHLPPYKYTASRDHPNDPTLDFQPPRGTLIFCTQCARFQVSIFNDNSAPAEPSQAATTPHAIFHIVPVDEASPHYAGRIILPSSTPSLSIFEFIVLSRCDGLLGLWDESRWGKRYYGCLLHVMAVRSMPSEPRVSERVGLGVIIESAWMESSAEERVVLLA